MNFDQETLYNLLPAIYRIRDAEQEYPLRALLGVMAGQIAVLEEDLAQLYDDQFIETCAEWVVPYLGDLLAYQPLYQLQQNQLPAKRGLLPSERAQVANTVAYRRRKGTAAVLEQLARDVTGWEANVVEFFQRLVTSQNLNHVRSGNQTPSLRNWKDLELTGTSFNPLAHTADVRRANSRHRQGKYNIPHIGIFLWRLQAYAVNHSPALEFGSRRYRFSPLGHDVPLFSEPEPEETITHLATYRNVALPLSRRLLAENGVHYYGAGKSLCLYRKNEGDTDRPYQEIPKEEITIRNLQGWSDTGRLPEKKYAIDPVLGRFTRPAGDTRQVWVSFHRGFSANLGGGSYDRRQTLFQAKNAREVSGGHDGVMVALAASNQNTGKEPGLISISDNNHYNLQDITLNADQHLILQAANERQPLLALEGEWKITGEADSELTLSGLMLSGGSLRISGLRRLRLRHCTLVPGHSLTWDGKPTAPDRPSLIVESAETDVELEHCITGGLQNHEGATAALQNCIIDATALARPAYAAPAAEDRAGGKLQLENCTVIGRVHTRLLEMASNTIFLARMGEEALPVRVKQKQAGCVRYSYVPPGSETPRRRLCQPQAAGITPHFTTLRFGRPGYCQLRPSCPDEIWRGADDGAEMGVFHDLYQPQREANLRLRLDEYLRFGLDAGIFYAS